MITILVDHNMKKQALLLWDAFTKSEWFDLLEVDLALFVDVGLAEDASDREVWRFAQINNMLLLTNNRSDNEVDSLESTIRDECVPTSLPVLTVGNLYRMKHKKYRERCVDKVVEIIMYLDNYLGTPRIFIP